MNNKFDHILPKIRNYLDGFSIIEDELQQRMRSQAIRDGLEHWLIPVEVGRFFYLLTKITGAERVYEIGSYLGYSATWFAQALPEDGMVVLTENNDVRYEQAVGFLGSSELMPKVLLKRCDALQDLRTDSTFYDIILIDHDKPYYSDAFLIAKKKVRRGGLIIADNVLWRNRIVDSQWQDDPSTRGILKYNELIMTDPEVVSLIVSIGDGVSLSYVVSPIEFENHIGGSDELHT
jgi:caffeoyl-CoA O-methyltransferase